jgi:hypothetical protein
LLIEISVSDINLAGFKNLSGFFRSGKNYGAGCKPAPAKIEKFVSDINQVFLETTFLALP